MVDSLSDCEDPILTPDDSPQDTMARAPPSFVIPNAAGSNGKTTSAPAFTEGNPSSSDGFQQRNAGIPQAPLLTGLNLPISSIPQAPVLSGLNLKQSVIPPAPHLPNFQSLSGVLAGQLPASIPMAPLLNLPNARIPQAPQLTGLNLNPPSQSIPTAPSLQGLSSQVGAVPQAPQLIGLNLPQPNQVPKAPELTGLNLGNAAIPQAPSLSGLGLPTAKSVPAAPQLNLPKTGIPQAPQLIGLNLPQTIIPQAPQLTGLKLGGQNVPQAPSLSGLNLPTTQSIPIAPQLSVPGSGVPQAPVLSGLNLSQKQGVPQAPQLSGLQLGGTVPQAPQLPSLGSLSQSGAPQAPQLPGLNLGSPGVPQAPQISIGNPSFLPVSNSIPSAPTVGLIAPLIGAGLAQVVQKQGKPIPPVPQELVTKKYHWEVIPKYKLANTVWVQSSPVDELDVDFSHLLTLFAEKAKPKEEAKGQSAKQIVMVLDQKKVNNVGILLSSKGYTAYAFSVAQTVRALNDLDKALLKLDVLNKLLAMAPNPEVRER